jgi:hypothetical protein
MRRLCLLLPLALAALPPAKAQTSLPALTEAEAPALPPLKPWIGDFDKMKERRLVRIIVPFSKTIYFLDKGAECPSGDSGSRVNRLAGIAVEGRNLL